VSDRRNLYFILGLKKGATEQQIKEAYKVLARKHHPDRNPNDPGARDRFIEIKEAYEGLIERKTNSPVFAQVEETSAEFRRGGGYRRLVLRIGGGVGVVLIAGIAFLFSGEIEFRFRDAMARSGDAKSAEKWLGPIATRSGPHAADARLDLARRYLDESDAASAARLLSTADDALGLAILGDIMARMGKRDDARKAYERAIGRAKTAETSARAYAGFVSSRDETAAVRVLEDAKARYPQDPWVAWMLAVRDLRAAKPQSARKTLDGNASPAAKAVLAAALVTEARLLGGDIRRLDDRKALVKDALALLDETASDGAAWPFGWLSPSVELLRRRPADWRPTTSLERIDVVRDLVRAAASSALGRDGFGEAVGYVKRARDVEESRDVLLLAGATHLARASKGDDDALKAKVAFASARTADPRSAAAAAGFALALAAEGTGEYEAESAAWKNAIELEPDTAEWHFGYARSLARAGIERSADRIAANRRAIKLAPDFGAPRLDLADALFDRDDLGEAVKALQSATTVTECASRAWRELGDYYYFAKQYPAAVTAFRNAAADPDAAAQSAAWLGAAKSLGRVKKMVDAHEALDRATSIDPHLKPNPDDPELAPVLRGYTAKTQSHGDDAAVRAQRLGDAHYKRGLYSEAFAAYYEASVIGDQQTRARSWHGMARCYANRGNLGEAVLSMDRALRISPELPLDPKDPGVKALLAAGYVAPGKGTR